MSHDGRMPRLGLWPCAKLWQEYGRVVDKHKNKTRLSCGLGRNKKHIL